MSAKRTMQRERRTTKKKLPTKREWIPVKRNCPFWKQHLCVCVDWRSDAVSVCAAPLGH
jgi:hypothetical protein